MPSYPLAQVLEVKQRRVEAAEKVVSEKLAVLQKEQKKLEEREAERDKVKLHKEEKLQQLREILDKESTSPKIQQMKSYLKVVDEKLKIEEKKVADQKKIVEKAEKDLEVAKEDLRQKRVEVDKIAMHKKDWEKGVKKELEIQETKETDELGSMTYSMQKKQRGNLW